MPSRDARADDPLEFEAEELETAPPFDEIALRGHARVQRGRFVVRGDEITVRQDGSGRIEGGGDVATCPCDPPPVRFAFSSAEWDSEGDVQMVAPRVELLGMPVAWLPWLWLRPPERVGLLMPELALRGRDGLLLGSGLHVPIAEGLSADVRGAGYVEGGAELSGYVEAPTSTTRVVWDHRRSARTVVQSTGHLDGAPPKTHESMPTGLAHGTLAWSADAVRGERAQRGTIDLFEATLPHDHARVEAAGFASDSLGATAGASLQSRADRGLGAVWLGPRADVGLGSSLGGRTVWAASSHAGVLMSEDRRQRPYAVGRVEGERSAELGPVAVRLDSRQRLRAAGAEDDEPSSAEAVASMGLTASLPFVRVFERDVVHWIAPELVARGAYAGVRGEAFRALGRAEPGPKWAAGGGLTSFVGSHGSESFRISARGGALGTDAQAQPTGHLRTTLESGWLGLDWTGGMERANGGDWGASTWLGGRIGDRGGVTFRGDTASRLGRSARGARWFSDESALPGDELTAIRSVGWTGGAELDVPWSASLTTVSRLDGRLDQPVLLRLGTALSYRHPCRCVGLGGSVAHRLGRGGVDVSLLIDLLP